MDSISFDRDFDPAYGQAVRIGPHVRRMTAPNGGPFTFHGTNSYIVGHGTVAIIDPGPDDPGHIDALLRAVQGETVSHIIVTHTHRDHSMGAARLAALTGAPRYGEGPHRAARPLSIDEQTMLDASGDMDFVPDHALADGERITGRGWTLTAIATPGHAANHMAFALDEAPILFSGDHVMGWSTTIVAPPDGAMADYMASLERLAARPETIYLPGHGGPIADAPAFVRALRAHRRLREAAIVERISRGDRRIADIVAVIYRETPKVLHGAAALAVLGHLEDLVARGRISAPGGLGLEAIYEPVETD
ncbi:MBL fold metallo-hydrolase [Kaistia dalseonensis]|uniref:Glyoxylase-like metal-dependent hydrolase (Beta-lactamase superfamily II) n=1 Tax=Kaistia dalseonensis TaxID=410840 RepID=A0ABU0HCZ1_9HYPH|nr:MBL fold metallo-hydrolase [Kaistia dalseonensis]MCX5497523.1 MBL fold metallo-hydrolase [Kaistia dalseonensis]MDQ0440162.1 glyoxylase-like metal-dependent hydrolase (beta-lactamase superfamily II) [Kaistia dalseonensis]